MSVKYQVPRSAPGIVMLYKYVGGWLKKGGGRQEFEGKKNPDSTKLINIE